MLKDDVILYSKLTGNDGLHTPIGIIGAYLDGYERGKKDIEVLACGEGELNVQSEPPWIPVAERLPKKSGVYTVTDYKGDVVRFVFITHSDSSREYWYRCAKAWMPLPEPYKEETE